MADLTEQDEQALREIAELHRLITEDDEEGGDWEKVVMAALRNAVLRERERWLAECNAIIEGCRQSGTHSGSAELCRNRIVDAIRRSQEGKR